MTREYNPNGKYFIVRAKDAHTWAEVYVSPKGWIRADPTPPSEANKLSQFEMFLDNIRMSWYRNVITYNSAKQVQLFSGIKNGVFGVSSMILNTVNDIKNSLKRQKNLLITLLIFSIFLILSRKNKGSKREAVLNAIERKIGERRKPSETLLEFAQRNNKLKELYEPIMLYYELRFSQNADASNKKEIIEKIIQLVKQIT